MKIFWYDFEGKILAESAQRFVCGTVYAENMRKAIENLTTYFGVEFTELTMKVSKINNGPVMITEDTVSGKYVPKKDEKIEGAHVNAIESCNDASLHRTLATLLGREDIFNDIFNT